MEKLLRQVAPDANQQFLAGNTVTLLKGEEVLRLLADENFRQGWDALYQACSWATVFQSRAFVAAWYRFYRAGYLPVLVIETAGSKLRGLLALARDHSGLLVGAGDRQAEYQVWLSADTQGSSFIQAALRMLRRHFPGLALQLKYLPGKTPLNWVSQDSYWRRCCLLRAHKHPFLKIDEARISQELKKKNRREKINRLKRLGELQFERVTSSETFQAIFDQLACQYDFRKGAMFDRLFFRTDPFRKQFLLNLFRQNLLHVTILKLNQDIIAANVGVMGKRWVHLQGLNAHAPLYARYSPGILHFLLLGQQLASENMEVFDLTPGSDTYKAGLASDHGLVYDLYMGSNCSRLVRQVRFKLLHHLKAGAARLGLQPEALTSLKRKAGLWLEEGRQACRQGLPASLRGAMEQAIQGKKSFVYRLCLQEPAGAALSLPPLQLNSLSDLLDYQAAAGQQSRWSFLAAAMRRLEEGKQCYTWSEGGCLLACVWTDSTGSAPGGAALPGVAAGALVLQEMYCHPAGGLQLQRFLAALVRQLAGGSSLAGLYLLVQGRQLALRSLLAGQGLYPLKDPAG